MTGYWTAAQPNEALGLKAYTNVRLLDPSSKLDIVCDSVGGLLTDGKRISNIGPNIFKNGIPKNAEEIDGEGFCLSPGLVDIRVQVREPGYEHKGTIESAGRAATAGGVTTMACLPNTKPIIARILRKCIC